MQSLEPLDRFWEEFKVKGHPQGVELSCSFSQLSPMHPWAPMWFVGDPSKGFPYNANMLQGTTDQTLTQVLGGPRKDVPTECLSAIDVLETLARIEMNSPSKRLHLELCQEYDGETFHQLTVSNSNQRVKLRFDPPTLEHVLSTWVCRLATTPSDNPMLQVHTLQHFSPLGQEFVRQSLRGAGPRWHKDAALDVLWQQWLEFDREEILQSTSPVPQNHPK